MFSLEKFKMAVRAMRQDIDKDGILVDTKEDLSDRINKFCQIFTDNYDLICEEYPIFR